MSANEDFFRERRAQAVFKHEILRRYAVVFGAKTGYTGRRVVLLDGYAGRGRYDDNTPGSPLMLATAARKLEGLRDITCIYVEQDDTDFENLRAVLAPYKRPNDLIMHGDVRQLLPQIMAAAQDAALFAFLDPFGTALDRTQLVDGLLRRSRSVPTDVLLHVSVSTVARVGGLLRQRRREGGLSPAELKTIAHVNRFLGGEWWQLDFAPIRDEDDQERATVAALRVTDTFVRNICQDTNHRAMSMPIRRRPGELPKYVLALFTRHPDGLWKFADCLGAAGRRWEGAWRADAEGDRHRKDRETHERSGQLLLDIDIAAPPFNPDAYEVEQREVWTSAIRANLIRLLGQHSAFYLTTHLTEVYGDVLGAAGERHVKAAIKALNEDRLISATGVGKYFFRERIEPVN